MIYLIINNNTNLNNILLDISDDISNYHYNYNYFWELTFTFGNTWHHLQTFLGVITMP
jgi:hypothetical protein